MSPHVTTLHPPDRVIALIDLVKSFRWPAVVLLVIALASPMLAAMPGLTPALGGGARVVMAGPLPLKVDPASLPAANEEVMRAVGAMDGDLLRVFLDMDQTAIYCGSLDAEYRAGMRRLAHINLVEQRFQPERGETCALNSVMTEEGRRVQTYLISLAVAMLKG